MAARPILFGCALLAFSCALRGRGARVECVCRPVDDTAPRPWGNMEVVFSEPDVLRSIEGDVRDDGDSPVAGALVELFNEPEYLLDPAYGDRRGHAGQLRIAACRTGSRGRFCFRGIPAGALELRVRHRETTGWNVTQYHVVVDPGSATASDKSIHVRLMMAN